MTYRLVTHARHGWRLHTTPHARGHTLSYRQVRLAYLLLKIVILGALAIGWLMLLLWRYREIQIAPTIATAQTSCSTPWCAPSR